MSMITVAAVGTAAVLMASLVRGIKSEYGFFLAAAAGMFIFFYGIQKLDSIIQVIGQIQESVHLDNVYFVTLMKMVGITYIGEFASGICRDGGCSFLGNQIEIFGKLSILAVSAPVVLALLQTLERFLTA